MILPQVPPQTPPGNPGPNAPPGPTPQAHAPAPERDKPWRKPRRRKNAPKTIAEAAAEGDFETVMTRLRARYVEPHGLRYAPEAPLNYLLEALEACRRQDPTRLAQTSLSIMLAFDLYLMLRMQLFIESTTRAADERHPSNPGDIPELVASEWLPRLACLQKEIMAIAKTMASVSHVQALAKQDSEKAEAGAAQDGSGDTITRDSSREFKPSSNPAPPARGHTKAAA